MKKLILAMFLVPIFCLNITGSANSSEVQGLSFKKPSISELEVYKYLLPEIMCSQSFDPITDGCLNSEYGFIMKVKVTEDYENILSYYQKNQYDSQGFVIGTKELVSSGYLLTDVIVQNIYYTGSMMDVNEGDTVTVEEGYYIAPMGLYFENAEDAEKLVLFPGTYNMKLIPGNEYIILGGKITNTDYEACGCLYTLDFNVGVCEVSKDAEDYVEEFYITENKESVIDKYVKQVAKAYNMALSNDIEY